MNILCLSICQNPLNFGLFSSVHPGVKVFSEARRAAPKVRRDCLIRLLGAKWCPTGPARVRGSRPSAPTPAVGRSARESPPRAGLRPTRTRTRLAAEAQVSELPRHVILSAGESTIPSQSMVCSTSSASSSERKTRKPQRSCSSSICATPLLWYSTVQWSGEGSVGAITHGTHGTHGTQHQLTKPGEVLQHEKPKASVVVAQGAPLLLQLIQHSINTTNHRPDRVGTPQFDAWCE